VITVSINGSSIPAEEGLLLTDAIRRYSPYGDEAVIAVYNGRTIRSIDEPDDTVMSDGDILNIFPLVIGG